MLSNGTREALRCSNESREEIKAKRVKRLVRSNGTREALRCSNESREAIKAGTTAQWFALGSI